MPVAALIPVIVVGWSLEDPAILSSLMLVFLR